MDKCARNTQETQVRVHTTKTHMHTTKTHTRVHTNAERQTRTLIIEPGIPLQVGELALVKTLPAPTDAVGGGVRGREGRRKGQRGKIAS